MQILVLKWKTTTGNFYKNVVKNCNMPSNKSRIVTEYLEVKKVTVLQHLRYLQFSPVRLYFSPKLNSTDLKKDTNLQFISTWWVSPIEEYE